MRLAAEFSVTAQRAEPSRLDMLQAPKVIKRPHTVLGANGERREDHYYWLRDDERQNPDVLEHLKVMLTSGNHARSVFNEAGLHLCAGKQALA